MDEAPSVAVLDAVRAGDLPALAAALVAGAPDSARDRYGRTALHVAVKTARRGCIAPLVAAGADPLLADPRGSSAFDAALEEGDPTLLEAMNAAGRALPTLTPTRRLAIAAGAPGLARWVLQPGEGPPPATKEETDFVDAWELDEERARATLPEGVTASLLHLIVDRHNWDSDNNLIVRVVEHPLCTALTARLAYDRGDLGYYDPSASVPEWQRDEVRWQADLFAVLRARFPEVLDPPE
ncbi:MAG: hypothetical protein U0234_30430 [Sandaracinus sp.]